MDKVRLIKSFSKQILEIILHSDRLSSLVFWVSCHPPATERKSSRISSSARIVSGKSQILIILLKEILFPFEEEDTRNMQNKEKKKLLWLFRNVEEYCIWLIHEKDYFSNTNEQRYYLLKWRKILFFWLDFAYAFCWTS